VRGLQDSTELIANWAKRYVEEQHLLFIGDVVIINEGDTLRADIVDYSESERVGEATGNVRLSDGEAVAHAPEGHYFADEKRAAFNSGVQLVDSSVTVTGDLGEYWSEEKRAEVGGNVRLDRENTYMEADSLTYLRSEELSFARGDVVVVRSRKDAEEQTQTVLFGDRVRADELAGTSEAEGNPLMIQLSRDSSGIDTLAIQSMLLTLQDADTVRSMTAQGSVRYWSQDLAAMADSMVYHEHEGAAEEEIGIIWLFGSPIAWTESTQITGDSMRAVLTDQTVDSLQVWGEVFISREDTTLGRINQVRGQSLLAWFDDDGLRTFRVRPNAEVLYFKRGENEEPDGALQVSGDEAVLVLLEDDPQSFSFGEHQGTYFPEEIIEMPLELEGFRWEPILRPLIEEFISDMRHVAWMRREAGN